MANGTEAALLGYQYNTPAHYDEWVALRRALRAGGPALQHFRAWMAPSHLGKEATLAGLTDGVARFLHSKVDAKVAGAAGAHAVPLLLRQSELWHIRKVAAFHAVTVDILEARADARPLALRAQGWPAVEPLQDFQEQGLLSEENPVGFPVGLSGSELN